MDFNFKLFNWKNEGAEPSDSLKTDGFKQGYKPAAGIFNRFWYLVTNAITELQTKFGAHADNKENPHGVTASQIGLDKVNNTPDSEKSVNTANFASEAGVGRKVAHALLVRFKGGSTEGTDLWTYDGSTGRSINITPKKIGAAEEAHGHTLDDINETTDKKYSRVADAISEDGTNYAATMSGVTELYNGMKITIIPNMNNVSLSPRLDINGLGDHAIRIAHSFNYAATNALKTDFIQAGRPVELKYDANCNLGVQGQGAWIFTDRVKTSAQDLYGTVPVASGGTGKTILADAFYPVGSIYMSVNNVDPTTLFGGTWERIKDRFLLSAGDTYAAGAEGGSENHKHGAGDLAAEISINTNTSLSGVPAGTFLSMDEVNRSVATDRHTVVSSTDVAVTRDNAKTLIASKYATKVSGETAESSNMPPYLSVYMWKRIA